MGCFDVDFCKKEKNKNISLFFVFLAFYVCTFLVISIDYLVYIRKLLKSCEFLCSVYRYFEPGERGYCIYFRLFRRIGSWFLIRFTAAAADGGLDIAAVAQW